VPLIRDAIIETGARLVIIDPMDAFLADGVNAYQSHAVRRALTPLKMLAEETRTAIVAISHLNKNSRVSPLYRIIGSIANTGAARSVLLVALDPEDEDSRILAGVKANLSTIPKSMVFHLERRDEDRGTHVEWDAFSDLTKDDLLRAKPAKARLQAMGFLDEVLAEGPMRVTEIESPALDRGIRLGTLRRASEEMGIKKTHVNPPGGHWEWSLPDAVDDSQQLAT
jgi:AAA domain